MRKSEMSKEEEEVEEEEQQCTVLLMSAIQIIGNTSCRSEISLLTEARRTG